MKIPFNFSRTYAENPRGAAILRQAIVKARLFARLGPDQDA